MEKKWFFPKVVLELMKELIFLMLIPVLRDRSSDDEVDDVCVPGGVTGDGEEMLVLKCVTDVFDNMLFMYVIM